MHFKDLTTNDSRWIAVIFLLILSFFTYVYGYWNPPALFWDENYHIASSQKYLNGIFFMEPHPPLGKMMIALGEVVLNRNAEDNQFIGTDYATNPPAGFSFAGYRLFPVLFAWLITPIIFGIFLLLTRKTLWAVLLSFLYVFDNALIVHLRSAMLESTMLFFSALTMLCFLLLLEWKDDAKKFRWASILFGLSFGCVMTTKAFGLIFIFLLPFIVYALYPRWKQCWRFLWMGGVAFLVVFVGVWQLHFSLAHTINPSLPDQGYYQASPEYKAILQNGKSSSLFAFPYMIRDSLKFVSHYEDGVPRLDLCKADENGSPWFFWPFGARTINYRWETPDGSAYRYLYLVSNPVVWFLGLIGVILTIILLAGQLLLPVAPENRLRKPFLLVTFLTLYISYMAAVTTIDRVMYLYHYFLPLFFSFILFGLVFQEFSAIGKWKLDDERKTSILLTFGVGIFLAFQFYRPFSYYEPLTDTAFNRRNILQIWDLKCVRCTPNSMLVVPGT